MKKTVFITLLGFYFLSGKAQIIMPGENLSELKKQGKLTGTEQIYNVGGGKKLQTTQSHSTGKSSQHISSMSASACNCWIPRDTSFHVVPFDGSGASGPPQAGDPHYANDDWSTAAIILPFNFCLYGIGVGTATNPMYINNNGNISFGAPYSTFSAVAFPSSTYTMVAPFWGDVETSNPGSGFVYYQLTPTHLIIQWDSVTHYQSTPGEDTLKNTFQLIITNGTDSILPAGYNISFCYGEMQWTTGDASGGTHGFGGTPATVGINKGDGVNYGQVSLFSNNSSIYTNPQGAPASGVSWLDYNSFGFDACGSSTNLPPLVLSNSSPCTEDTLTAFEGDTLTQRISFIGPEPSQSVTVNISAPTISSGFSILSSTVGTSSSLVFQVATAGLAPGYYPITAIGTDNGTPIKSTTLNYVVHILPANITTGIKGISSKQILIYPNPSAGNFVIETNSSEKQFMQVYDVTGKVVLSQTLTGKSIIDASNLSEGVYNLCITGSQGKENKRLVIAK